jgi:hypothetical protein
MDKMAGLRLKYKRTTNCLPDRTHSSVKQLAAIDLRCDCSILSSAFMSGKRVFRKRKLIRT